jgi:hypothetical protein
VANRIGAPVGASELGSAADDEGVDVDARARRGAVPRPGEPDLEESAAEVIARLEEPGDLRWLGSVVPYYWARRV